MTTPEDEYPELPTAKMVEAVELAEREVSTAQEDVDTATRKLEGARLALRGAQRLLGIRLGLVTEDDDAVDVDDVPSRKAADLRDEALAILKAADAPMRRSEIAAKFDPPVEGDERAKLGIALTALGKAEKIEKVGAPQGTNAAWKVTG